MNESIGPNMLYLYILKYGYYVDYIGPDAEDRIVYLKKELNWADNGTTGTAEATVRLTPYHKHYVVYNSLTSSV